MASRSEIEVRPVRSRADTTAFIDVAWRVYQDDPHWVPPLKLERRLHLSSFNPFFQHGEWQGFLALCDGEVVGRVSAQIDRLHRERYGPDTGQFGFLDAVDDPAVFRALMQAAEAWLAERGASRITGPYSFSINQECGLLAEGFDTPPVILMPHGRPWFGPHLEAADYRPAKELLAYWVHTNFEPPRVMRSLLDRYTKKVSVRPLRRKQLAEELVILRDLFNDAWSENWGFVPFTEAEFDELGQMLKLVVNDELVQIAELDGAPVAFIVGLPNINEVLRELNGRLLPLGWWRLMRRLRRREIATGRVPLMGVRKDLQKSNLGSALAFLVIGRIKEELYARGIKHVEMGWILEDNKGMRSILDAIGSRLYKRYRIYEKLDMKQSPAPRIIGGRI